MQGDGHGSDTPSSSKPFPSRHLRCPTCARAQVSSHSSTGGKLKLLRGCFGEKYCLSYFRPVELCCSTVLFHVNNRLLATSVIFLAASLFLLYNPCSMCHATELHTLTQPKFCLIACDIVQSKNRRRVGRPITYKGDPDAKNLTEGERRKVKRRIANRESARRVRARRAETLGELQIKVRPVPAHPHWFSFDNDLRQEKCSAGCHAIDTGCTLHYSMHCTMKS